MSGGGYSIRAYALGLGRRDRLHGAAVAVGEGRGVDLLELDLAVQHLLLPPDAPAPWRGTPASLPWRTARGFRRCARAVLPAWLSRMIWSTFDSEFAQLAADCVGRADQAAAQRAAWASGFSASTSVLVPQVYRAGGGGASAVL